MLDDERRNNYTEHSPSSDDKDWQTQGTVSKPYSQLIIPLQETRNALGIRLEGSVLIVDEAHNLVDAVNSAHGASITLAHMKEARIQLNGYYECYRSRLSPGIAFTHVP